MDILQLAALGIGLGGVYAILALGVIAIYRGTGTPNFSQGAVAMFSAYVFFGLRDDGGLAWPLALVLAIVVAAAIGVAFHVLVMRQLRNSPALARIVATLALLLLLHGVALTFFDVTTQTPIGILPNASVTIGDLIMPRDRLIVAGIAVALAVVLGVLARRTRTGVAIRALAESEKGAVLLGYSPMLLSAATWAIGFALAAVAGVLVSPIAGLDANALTLLVVPVFGAALIARFSSFAVAVVAGLGIGMVQSVLQGYSQPGPWWTWLWTGPGRAEAFPALVIIVVMIISGRLLPQRGEFRTGRLPISPHPRHLLLAPILAVLIGVPFLLLISRSWANAATTSIIGALIALSLVVVTGFVGQVSLAQMAFAGVGGLAAARIAAGWLPFPAVILLSGLVACALGVLIGSPALRVRGPSLAIVTLSAALIFQKLLFQDPRVIGGGGTARVPEPTLFGLTLHTRGFAIASLVVLVAAMLAVAGLRMGRFGRRALAVRENERAAAAAGISVAWYKLSAFAVSAFIAGVGGAMLSYQQLVFAYERFTVFESLTIVILAYIGGIGMVSGALFAGLGASGGLFYKLLTTTGIGSYHEVIAGVALLLAIQLHPDGLASLGASLRARRAARGPAPPPDRTGDPPPPDPTPARAEPSQTAR